ncbi:MAG: kinase-like domain-containing protein [Benjaminiella poitrasii]|nr:MAG: kinase-like domain-containing protein [Benjaminiella poitrasii]
MSNALLLRLFTSEYFNAWIAISYIFRYPDNVGIQHYLCTQLRNFPIAEIEFFLPQLMHLLITRPTESVALECYLLDACEKSMHIAVMSLWYLQAYLSDLSGNPQNPSFQLCKRVLNQCQAIIFQSDADEKATSVMIQQKVHENAFPALVGMGAMLAGIGQPLVTKPVGSVSIAQGRKDNESKTSQRRRRRRPTSLLTSASTSSILSKGFTISLEDLHRGKAFSVSRYLKEAQKKLVTSTKLNSKEEHVARLDTKSMQAMAQSSVPVNNETTTTTTNTKTLGPLYALSKLSLDHRRQLLRTNYFRSEMQFLLALVDIATRLVIVPKEARLSALHAELTLLNHNLPAEICMPLWCPATVERPYHHRIVRISPTDAVVLNSAERAPYLLMIEVLDDEISLENGFKSSLSSLKKKKKNKRTSASSIVRRDEATVSGFDAEEFAEKMKTAAILLAQLQLEQLDAQTIRQKIIAEMMALEDDRLDKMALEATTAATRATEQKLDEDNTIAMMVVNKDDPSAAVFSEEWETKENRIRASSPFGHLPNWRLISVIVKNGADLRQEQFAIQLIREMQKIWQDTQVPVWVKYIRVLVTSDDSGLVETVKNSISVHSIKKEAYRRKWNQNGAIFSLKDYYTRRWGREGSASYRQAQDAFMRSLAGYSVASYLMQIKDRHNGNLLIDDKGHIVHIDFGFILSNSPGSVGFEMAPFKLPQEYIDILDGVQSPVFREYRRLTKEAFLAVRKHSENILLLTEMMAKDSKLPCFQNTAVLASLRDRFQLHLTEKQVEAFVDRLIMSSCCNVFTRLYDTYQYYSQVKKKKKKGII